MFPKWLQVDNGEKFPNNEEVITIVTYTHICARSFYILKIHIPLKSVASYENSIKFVSHPSIGVL